MTTFLIRPRPLQGVDAVKALRRTVEEQDES
jgi:hypothetical protein